VLRDVAIAVGILVSCVLVNSPNQVVTLAGNLGGSTMSGRVALWWAATVPALGGVALRRRWPLPMLIVCTVAAAVHVGLSAPIMIVDLSMPILLYTVAARYGPTVSITALSAMLLLVLGWSLYSAARALPVPGLPDRIPMDTVAIGGPVPAVKARPFLQDTWSGVLVLGSALVASWAIGAGTRGRRAFLDQLHARARDLERESDQQAALAVAAERARISRELHDVVAHGLSVMVTQAQGATAAFDRRPDDTRTALDAIVRTGRDSLADMRRVLAAVDGTDAQWHPPQGLNQLPSLISQVTTAGTPVRLRIDGTPAALPSAVDLSAYRIVQEALTNTVKHAGTGASADVAIRYQDTEVVIDVHDNGSARSNGGSGGNGLRGMRERTRLLGGTLAAGPRVTGGFSVHARLPIRDTA
jgi:signal transduction histidine kinase